MLDLTGIKEREAKATKGPWWDATAAIRRKYATQNRKGAWRAKPGESLNNTAVQAILAGPQLAYAPTPPLTDFEIGGYDQYDYEMVFSLYWRDIRGKEFSGFFHPADLDFLTHAREDIPALIAEVKRLRAELGG